MPRLYFYSCTCGVKQGCHGELPAAQSLRLYLWFTCFLAGHNIFLIFGEKWNRLVLANCFLWR